MEEILNMGWLSSITESVGGHMQKILIAFAILIVGWFVALILRWVISKTLGNLKINKKFQTSTSNNFNIEKLVSNVVFYGTLVLVFLFVLKSLNIGSLSAPIDQMIEKFFALAPKLFKGSMLAVIAWLLATVCKSVIGKTLGMTLDKKLAPGAGLRPLSGNISNVFYWLVILLFLPAILNAFGTDSGLLAPVQNMIDKTLSLLPNLFGAIVVGFIGWLLGNVFRNIVTGVLSSIGADKFGEKVGLKGTMNLSSLAGLIVYILVFVTALIQAFDILKIEAISGPAKQMLNDIIGVVPNIIAAAVILIVFYVLAKIISSLVTNLLGGLGFDQVPAKMGLEKSFKNSTPSAFAGKLVMFFMMMFAVVTATHRLNFPQLTDAVNLFIGFAGKVFLGAVIFAVGFWISNLAYKAVSATKSGPALASIVRMMIIGLVLAMGLRAMGIANEIVNTAFTLTLGAAAVAIALSFGLGGREAAGKAMERWLSKF